jgi:hypothetical protein
MLLATEAEPIIFPDVVPTLTKPDEIEMPLKLFEPVPEKLNPDMRLSLICVTLPVF